jgi:molecular chaperone IbpA
MTGTRRITTDLLNDPLYIGFDSIFNKLHHTTKSPPNYPPYNLIKTGECSYLIELAVAGFDEDDFDVELYNGVLTISATIDSGQQDVEYLHRGIAARSFERKFTLADTVEVERVSLHQGMLNILLQNVIPEAKKPKKIPVGRSTKELLTE